VAWGGANAQNPVHFFFLTSLLHRCSRDLRPPVIYRPLSISYVSNDINMTYVVGWWAVTLSVFQKKSAFFCHSIPLLTRKTNCIDVIYLTFKRAKRVYILFTRTGGGSKPEKVLKIFFSLNLLKMLNRRKTALCRNFSQTGDCPFGARCNYAHGEHELQMAGAPQRPPYGSRPPFQGGWGAGLAPPMYLGQAAYGGYPQPYAQQYAQPYGQQYPQQYAGGYSAPPASFPGLSFGKGAGKGKVRQYKTTLCQHWVSTGACPFEHKCAFAHGEAELQPKQSQKRGYEEAFYGMVPMHGVPMHGLPMHGVSMNGFAMHSFPGMMPKHKRPRPELLKTVMCKHFEGTGDCPFKERCNFAHGVEELQTPGAVALTA